MYYTFLYIVLVKSRFLVLKSMCIIILSSLCFFLFQLKCCGYNYGNASDFPQFISLQDRGGYSSYFHDGYFKTPLFCCHSNPLTQTYNSDFTTCTSPGGSDYRYSEVTTCSNLKQVFSSPEPKFQVTSCPSSFLPSVCL